MVLLTSQIFNLKSARGFSVLELLVVTAILALTTTVAFGSFSRLNGRETVDKETRSIASLITLARSQTVTSLDASVYGVHFESGSVTLFKGSSYVPSDIANVVTTLSPLVHIASTTLGGGGSNIVFSRITGETSQNGTVTLSLIADTAVQKTITIEKTGLVEVN